MLLSILTALAAIAAAGVSIWASRRRITWLAALALTLYLAAVAATLLLIPAEPEQAPHTVLEAQA
ncbi:hypothetical protein ACFYY8_33750 [Streptosporangium sp. NPDC001559]|uniref:hypothetical protein n=1 Tax=Streptosporangium sp. NPDC001559 TaxID=3366187 RepID=UPI0036F1772A